MGYTLCTSDEMYYSCLGLECWYHQDHGCALTVVLVGLIYMICEMYIDDCSVFGDTNVEFVSRLRLVFE